MEKQRNSSTEHSRSVPKLRFPEFKDEWEKKKLGEVADIIMGQSPDGDTYNTNGNGIPLINGPVEFTEKYPVKIKWTSKPTKYCQDKDVLFCVRGSTTGRMNIANDKYCIGRGVAAIRANNFSISSFIELILIKNLVEILSYTTGSTFQNIDSKSLKEFKSTIPSLPEQKRIASFFTILDKKIAELKQKKTLLEQYKKGIMQKLFSQELRFKDENGKEFPKWEMKKLGEVFYCEKGKGISKNKVVVNGKYECVLYGELYTKYNEVIFDVVSKTNEIDGIKSKIGDLLLPSSTTTTGIDLANVTALNKDNILLGGDITVLRSVMEINNVYYAYYLSNHKKEEIASYAQGSTIVHLYYSHIKDMVIDLPSFKEQTKIANFLSSIDVKINCTENHIQQTQQYKKGLLQKMFV